MRAAVLLLEQVEGEVETEDIWQVKGNRSDAFRQLLEEVISTAELPRGPHSEPGQEAIVSMCRMPKPLFRNELGREYRFKEKALPSQRSSFFGSLGNGVLTGFPLLFAGLIGES